jgi:S-methylmethionine-dependent homocysteine/selenocysteine methylase
MLASIAMAKYRTDLPQLKGELLLTDGGLETVLIFQKGLELPEFATFPLLETEEGRQVLKAYYQQHLDLAKRYDAGFILGSLTWRANPDWATKLGYSKEGLHRANCGSVEFLEELIVDGGKPHLISGCIGPRGDGYVIENAMTAEQARDYHSEQIESLASTNADLVTVLTMNYEAEATGVALAAKDAGIPCAVSFTVETDGKLPSGQSVKSAIEGVDDATSGAPAYFMINCAHPTHFSSIFEEAGSWKSRIGGLRANASSKSHAELDECTVLDDGNPTELAAQYRELRDLLPNLNVLGGCCGTDLRHIGEIAKACLR